MTKHIPNMFRTASGAWTSLLSTKSRLCPNLELDDKNKKLYGSETITYYNNAPEVLEYLWVQLEQNIERPDLRLFIENQNMDKSIMATILQKYMDKPFEGRFQY